MMENPAVDKQKNGCIMKYKMEMNNKLANLPL